MSVNTTNASRDLPEGAREAAVMQTISENAYLDSFWNAHIKGDSSKGQSPTLRSFLEFCEQRDKTNPDVEILHSYLVGHPEAGDFEILNVDGESGTGNKVLLGMPCVDGTKKYYFAFQGTTRNEWMDNAEGMTSTVTLQQEDAANFFDEMVRKYNIVDSDQVVVTGHSKGGNKAQYITLSATFADQVDSCIALDGQGFSPEAVELWKKYPEVYESRRNKIILIAGENDYVHVLGQRVAAEENTYYVRYHPLGQELENADNIMAWHQHTYLFMNYRGIDVDGKGYYGFSSELQTLCSQSDISRKVQEINDYLMELPKGQREDASATFMSIMMLVNGGTSLDGYTPSLPDIISTLNIVYDLLDQKLGRWDDELLGRFAPKTYGTLNNIHSLINDFQNLYNEWQEYRQAQAHAQAVALVCSDPYVYIDTETWYAMGNTLRRLGSVNYARIRIQLINITGEIQDVIEVVCDINRKANSLVAEVEETIASASAAVAAFYAGDFIDGIFLTLEAALNALQAAKAALKLLKSIIDGVQRIYKSLTMALNKIQQALALIGVEDRVVDLGNYLSETAQEFEMVETQNLALVSRFGV